MKKTLTLAAMTAVGLVGTAHARDTISLAGSSTVAPFAQIVVERFNNTSEFTAEYNTTGTGGGFRLFCGGLGEDFTDFSGASREIRDSEVEQCNTNGVGDVHEIIIGFDGIVIANSVEGPALNLTKEEIFLALAAQVPVDGTVQENPYTSWNEINPDLPAAEIEVLGPPPTSGTRDAFVELVMEEACESFPEIAALEDANEELFEQVCTQMREDGGFIEAGEDDNLIVARLEDNAAALGIFGFSFLDQNLDVIQGSMVDDVEPTFENIASGDYPVSRSLFLYVKEAHISVIPGMAEFIAELTAEGTLGDEGYLVDAGLIPLTADARATMREAATGLGQ